MFSTPTATPETVALFLTLTRANSPSALPTRRERSGQVRFERRRRYGGRCRLFRTEPVRESFYEHRRGYVELALCRACGGATGPICATARREYRSTTSALGCGTRSRPFTRATGPKVPQLRPIPESARDVTPPPRTLPLAKARRLDLLCQAWLRFRRIDRLRRCRHGAEKESRPRALSNRRLRSGGGDRLRGPNQAARLVFRQRTRWRLAASALPPHRSERR